MAWTQTDIDKLKAAMAQGARRVKYADREVEYRDLAEMRQTLGLMESEVNAAAGTRHAKQIRFQTDKGLG
jgi:hypothetical protein